MSLFSSNDSWKKYANLIVNVSLACWIERSLILFTCPRSNSYTRKCFFICFYVYFKRFHYRIYFTLRHSKHQGLSDQYKIVSKNKYKF